MAIKSLSIRIDDAVLDKLHIVIRDCIAAYEKQHGPIVLQPHT